MCRGVGGLDASRGMLCNLEQNSTLVLCAILHETNKSNKCLEGAECKSNFVLMVSRVISTVDPNRKNFISNCACKVHSLVLS